MDPPDETGPPRAEDDDAPEEPSLGGPSTRLFQINENDLAELERILPQVLSRMYPLLGKQVPGNTKLRVRWYKIIEIIKNVRWNYGPPEDCIVIPCGNGEQEPPEENGAKA